MMYEIKNMWGEKIRTVLTMDDIVIGRNYKGCSNIIPGYLNGTVVKVEKKCKTKVKVSVEGYEGELFSVYPQHLQLSTMN